MCRWVFSKFDDNHWDCSDSVKEGMERHISGVSLEDDM